MGTMDKESLASEIVAGLSKNVMIINDKLQIIYEEISKVKSIFRAVHYAYSNGGITKDETDEAMNGIETMLEVLKDNAEETIGMVKEIM